MNYRDPFSSIHHALAYAQLRLPQEVRWWPPHVPDRDLNVYCFRQTWANTACGFDELAGQAICSADTAVIVVDGPQKHAAVFFNRRFAYAIERPNPSFWEDLTKQVMRRPGIAEEEYETR